MNLGEADVEEGGFLPARVPACAGMTGGGAGVAEGGTGWVIGARTASGGGTWPLTPHLTSPFQGGGMNLGEADVEEGGFLPAQE